MTRRWWIDAQVKVTAHLGAELILRYRAPSSAQARAQGGKQNRQRAKLRNEFTYRFLQGVRPCPVFDVLHRFCHPGAMRDGSYMNMFG